MKHLIALCAIALAFTSVVGQTNIYNPDSDEDGLITAEDLLIFLSLYNTPFDPNPCNCACYSNLFIEDFAHQNESVLDTITAQEVAANLFYAQPDSIRMDFVIAPYGVGELPFHDGVDTLYYDTLAFSQTYPFNFVSLAGMSGNASNQGYAGYGNGIAFMQYRNPYIWNYSSTQAFEFAFNLGIGSNAGAIDGGIDLVDNGYPLRLEAENLCPNMLNEEYWEISWYTQFFQVEEGVYANVIENAASDVPTHPDLEMGDDWIYHYPLSWIVFTAIYVETEE
jgi:hypothetical protein